MYGKTNDFQAGLLQRRSANADISTELRSEDDEIFQDFDAEQIRRLHRGLPPGLWRVEYSPSMWGGETETPFMFFRNKTSLEEFLTTLPSLLLTLPPGGGMLNDLVVPLVECDDTNAEPGDEATRSLDEVNTSQPHSSVLIQKISFPLYSDEDEIEDILVERSFNSIRISFRFIAPHVELRATLHSVLMTLHHSLSRIFTLAVMDQENLMSMAETQDSSHTTPNVGGPLSTVAYRMAWSHFFEQEPRDPVMKSQLAVSLFRKHPVKSFDLSLVITTRHVALYPVETIQERVSGILKTIQNSVLASAKLLYWKASAVGSAYVDAFEQEMEKMYNLTEQ